MTSLLRAALGRLNHPPPARGGLVAGPSIRLDAEGRMEIFIYVDAVTPERLETLRGRGAVIGLYDPKSGLISARVPPDRVAELAGYPFVRRLDMPIRGRSN